MGKEGIGGRLSFKKFPKNLVCKKTNLEPKKLEAILDYMGEIRLCCPKSLKRSMLYFPNFRKRADNYSKYIKSHFKDTSNNISGEESTIDKIIKEYIATKGWKLDKDILRDVYKRNCRPAKNLSILTKDTAIALKAMAWTSQYCKGKGLSWTLETIAKMYPDFLQHQHVLVNSEFKAADLDCQICGGTGFMEADGERTICTCRRNRR